MSTLQGKGETVPKIVQISANTHRLIALDENGGMWILDKHICDTNEIETILKAIWRPLPNKIKI